MAPSIRDIPKKKRGRPKTTGRGEALLLRLHKQQLAKLDAWTKSQDDNPTRQEALRRLIDLALQMKEQLK
jgi:hypothetical protein